MMWPVGWEALKQWGDGVARIEPLAGGVANDVWRVRVNGQRAVGRLGVRSDADLAWETALLERLDRAGLTVPVPIPTTAGRLFADGVVVMTYVEGGPPETEAAWQSVADTLRQLHRLPQGWPQRRGWRCSTVLLLRPMSMISLLSTSSTASIYDATFLMLLFFIMFAAAAAAASRVII